MDESRDSTLGIVASDIGAAQVLASYSSGYPGPQLFCVVGLAKKFFLERLGPSECNTLEQVIGGADWVLTGTGWQSTLNLEAIRLAKRQGKFVATFVDSVINIRQRFEVGEGQLLLPDEIWVIDDAAFALVAKEFPKTTVKVKPVPLRSEFLERVKLLEALTGPPLHNSLLYLSDNTAGTRRAGLLDSHHSDEYCFQSFLRLSSSLPPFDFPVTVRLHPTESEASWAWAEKMVGHQIVFSVKKDLEEDVATHAILVGRRSNALILGALCGRAVFTLSKDFYTRIGADSQDVRLLH